jgi:hypothetical protein
MSSAASSAIELIIPPEGDPDDDASSISTSTTTQSYATAVAMSSVAMSTNRYVTLPDRVHAYSLSPDDTSADALMRMPAFNLEDRIESNSSLRSSLRSMNSSSHDVPNFCWDTH